MFVLNPHSGVPLHRQLTEQIRRLEKLGIPYDVTPYRTATKFNPGGPSIRFHIGLEDVGDLIADLERGFAAAFDPVVRTIEELWQHGDRVVLRLSTGETSGTLSRACVDAARSLEELLHRFDREHFRNPLPQFLASQELGKVLGEQPLQLQVAEKHPQRDNMSSHRCRRKPLGMQRCDEVR